MPGVLVGVQEDGDVGEVVVACNQVGEVDHGFAAFVSWDEEGFRRGVDGVGRDGPVWEGVLEP